MSEKGVVSRFFYGAGFFGRGLRLVFDRRGGRGLWPLVLGPTLLCTAVAVLGGWAGWRWAEAFIDRHVAGHGAFLTAIVTVLMVLLVTGIAYVAFLVSSWVATAPFAGFLSEKTERLTTGSSPGPEDLLGMVREMIRATLHTIGTMTLYLMTSGLIIVGQFFVAPLAPLFWLAGVIVTGLFLAYDAFSLPLERRQASWADKWAFVGRHQAESLGFGMTVALVLAVPGIGLLVPAVAIVSGTLLYLDLSAQHT